MCSRKKIIGIVPLVDSERDSYWMLPGYMKIIEACGAIPVMMPLTSDLLILQQLVSTLDGFLFTGGHDVSPSLYGETPIAQCGEISTQRDEMETALLQLVMDANKPALGICRGIQFFNVALGGTLYQDLNTQHPSTTPHQMSAPYDRPIHTVDIVKDSALHTLMQKDTLSVNSYHHQAIATLAPSLEAMAIAPDGIIEAVRHKELKFLWAVQWHPEFAFNGSNPTLHTDSLKLINLFISEC